MGVNLKRTQQPAPNGADIEANPASRSELTVMFPLKPEREEIIGKAAYYRAEQRGFAPGSELDDWLAAEQELLRQERAL